MNIQVKTNTGATIPLTCNSSDKVIDIKRRCNNSIYTTYDLLGNECSRETPPLGRLAFSRTSLEDNKNLGDYNIQDNSILYYIIHLSWGPQ